MRGTDTPKVEEKLIDLSKFTQECLDELRLCQTDDNYERGHTNADKAIVKFLQDLGFSDIAYEYDQVHRWYS